MKTKDCKFIEVVYLVNHVIKEHFNTSNDLHWKKIATLSELDEAIRQCNELVLIFLLMLFNCLHMLTKYID